LTLIYPLTEKYLTMKEALKYLGILIILTGVVILVITVSNGVKSNTGLTVSAFLVVLGLVAHILLNRYVNE